MTLAFRVLLSELVSLLIVQMASQPWSEVRVERSFILLGHETAGTSPTGCELTSILCPTTILSNSNTHADLFGPGINPRPLHM
jgi:hypothetical protein